MGLTWVGYNSGDADEDDGEEEQVSAEESKNREGMKQAAEIFRLATPGRHEIKMQERKRPGRSGRRACEAIHRPPGFGVVAAFGAVMLVLNIRMIQSYD